MYGAYACDLMLVNTHHIFRFASFPSRCAVCCLQIKFFKSTMFRKTIETKSLSETRQVWESFIEMTKDAIRQRKPGVKKGGSNES